MDGWMEGWMMDGWVNRHTTLGAEPNPGFYLSVSSLYISERSIAFDDMYGLISKTSLVP